MRGARRTRSHGRIGLITRTGSIVGGEIVLVVVGTVLAVLLAVVVEPLVVVAVVVMRVGVCETQFRFDSLEHSVLRFLDLWQLHTVHLLRFLSGGPAAAAFSVMAAPRSHACAGPSKASSNRARPMRTMVAPSAIASCQSSLMPIESSSNTAACSPSSPSRTSSRKRARSAKHARARCASPLRRHRHKPAHAHVRKARAVLQHAGHLARRETALARLPRHVHLEQHVLHLARRRSCGVELRHVTLLVQRVHERGIPHDVGNAARLDVADEVQVCCGKRARFPSRSPGGSRRSRARRPRWPRPLRRHPPSSTPPLRPRSSDRARTPRNRRPPLRPCARSAL